MPVRLDGLVGLASDRYEYGAREKRYVWLKVGPLGIELFFSRNIHREIENVGSREALRRGAAPPKAGT